MSTRLVRAARILLVILIVLLYYGSLYPGVVNPGVTLGQACSNLLHSFYIPTDPRSLVDFVLNILVYIPPGVVFVFAFRWNWKWRIVGAVAMGLAITVSVEVLQGFVSTRNQSLLDCIANTLGTALGAILGYVGGEHFADRFPWGLYRSLERDSLMLLAVWLMAQWFPLFPSIGFYRVSVKLQNLAHGRLTFVPLLIIAAEWIICALVIEKTAGAAAGRWLAAAFCAPLMRLFIQMREVTLIDVLGAVLGLALWRVVLSRREWRHWAGLLVIVVGVVLSQLAPFNFATGKLGAFDWRPFEASLATGQWELAIVTLFAKAFRYGAVVWALRQCGAMYTVGGVLAAAMLFATELAQQYLPGRSPEIADPLIALLMAVAMWMARATGFPHPKRSARH